MTATLSQPVTQPRTVAIPSPLRPLLKLLSSLKLTVALLTLSMLLILAGTTAQQDKSVWDVQHIYFHAWACFLEIRLLLPLWKWGQQNVGGAFLFPGGYTLISLLLTNLLAAHISRFKWGWKRTGILLTHGGLILLLLGEMITSQVSRESQMSLDVGSSVNYTFDLRDSELAITEPQAGDHDVETVVPSTRLLRGGTIDSPGLPFTITIDQFNRNSRVLGPMEAGSRKNDRATAGPGIGLTLIGQPRASGTDTAASDLPSAYVTLSRRDGSLLGTYLVSTIPLDAPFPPIDQPQTISIDGKTYWLQLRFKRTYKPYTLKLLNFTHDRYTGTDVAKNFASSVELIDPLNGVDRTVTIWMNHPLRYAGETFFQASFKPGDQTSVLQIVHNPGWLIPYISCGLVALGLLIHFAIHLVKFLNRERKPRAERKAITVSQGSVLPAVIATALCTVYVISQFAPQRSSGDGYDLKTFEELPVSYEGRTMPLDSLARNSLRIISGRSVAQGAAGSVPAIRWMLDSMSDPKLASSYPVFRVDYPDILSLLKLDETKTRFSLDQVAGSTALPVLKEQYEKASMVTLKQRDLFQRKIIELGEHVLLFNKLAGLTNLYLSPPLVDSEWRTFGEAMKADSKQRDPGAESFLGLLDAAAGHEVDQFNTLATAYSDLVQQRMPGESRKLRAEVLFNQAEPFITCMGLYVIAFVLAAISWLKWRRPMARAALWVLIFTVIVHTAGLAARIYIQGRPPVTNLYSSAIFIAWAVAGFCVLMELIYRNGVAVAAAASIAFPSLLIAHYLAADGDTMRMLQAVLDTNIWLATHVVVVTLGYSATFLAGFIGIGYVIARTVGKLTPELNTSLSRMIYGVVCFAMLFSFVGTILGGIWADQSWGRFWGWDPKENGAVLIVVWNAIVLHARFGGLVRQRGLALLAIFGNVVTAWSWFGTNLLGVGLHSYGFMESGVFWLFIWFASQILVIAIGLIPLGSSAGRRFSKMKRPHSNISGADLG